MKHMNNHYGKSGTLTRFGLQMFADDESDDDNSESDDEDENTEGEDDQEDSADKEEKKYSDKDLDRIIGKRFARWAEEKEKAVKDAKEEAAKLAKMNTQQKQEYELEKAKSENADMQKEIESLKQAQLKSELSKEAARTMKEQHSIIATQDMLDFVVGDDADQTNERIEKLVGIILDDRKAQETARATGRTPKSFSNNGNTLTEIDKRIAKYK